MLSFTDSLLLRPLDGGFNRSVLDSQAFSSLSEQASGIRIVSAPISPSSIVLSPRCDKRESCWSSCIKSHPECKDGSASSCGQTRCGHCTDLLCGGKDCSHDVNGACEDQSTCTVPHSCPDQYLHCIESPQYWCNDYWCGGTWQLAPLPEPCFCPKPPFDWCQDGWIGGDWFGNGDEPCWCPKPPDDYCGRGWVNGVWNRTNEHEPCWYPDGFEWQWNRSYAKPFLPHLGPAQVLTLILIPIFLVGILIMWNVKILALAILLPTQLYTNMVHELGHLLAGAMGGAKICSVTIDPGCGPLSTMRNGHPMFTLLAGYTSSIFFGTLLVFFAFDERCSKVVYIVHAPLWIAVFFFTVGWWPKIQITVVLGTTIALWFIWEARLLRFYLLWLGLMSLFYVLWDCIDDFFRSRKNESDASLLSRCIDSVSAGFWFLIFLILASGHLALAVCLGLHFFRGNIHAPATHFLTTKSTGGGLLNILKDYP